MVVEPLIGARMSGGDMPLTSSDLTEAEVERLCVRGRERGREREREGERGKGEEG